MSVSAFRDTQGQPSVIVRCDTCGAEISMRCVMERRRGSDGPLRPNVGQANRKAINQGWEVRGESHACPSCIEEKRAKSQKKEEKLNQSATDELRQPTREQKRAITELLQDVYDTKAQRYRGAETDKTVATTLGDGIMWGWVAQVREDMFGPDGNEANDILAQEVRAWLSKADALSARVHDEHAALLKSLRDFNDAKAEVARLVQRLVEAPRPKLVATK